MIYVACVLYVSCKGASLFVSGNRAQGLRLRKDRLLVGTHSDVRVRRIMEEAIIIDALNNERNHDFGGRCIDRLGALGCRFNAKNRLNSNNQTVGYTYLTWTTENSDC